MKEFVNVSTVGIRNRNAKNTAATVLLKVCLLSALLRSLIASYLR